jgi:hypothetical protein
MIIAVDFDGTCVTHDFPEMGTDIGAAPVLRRLVESGHKLILNTMRSGEYLIEAESWFRRNNIPLWAVGKNPEQSRWTTSNKTYAHVYIDDAALGVPLILAEGDGIALPRAYVDWKAVEDAFIEMGAFKVPEQAGKEAA